MVYVQLRRGAEQQRPGPRHLQGWRRIGVWDTYSGAPMKRILFQGLAADNNYVLRAAHRAGPSVSSSAPSTAGQRSAFSRTQRLHHLWPGRQRNRHLLGRGFQRFHAGHCSCEVVRAAARAYGRRLGRAPSSEARLRARHVDEHVRDERERVADLPVELVHRAAELLDPSFGDGRAFARTTTSSGPEYSAWSTRTSSIAGSPSTIVRSLSSCGAAMDRPTRKSANGRPGGTP